MMLAADTELTILERVGEWLKVTAVNHTGYRGMAIDLYSSSLKAHRRAHFPDPDDPRLTPLTRCATQASRVGEDHYLGSIW